MTSPIDWPPSFTLQPSARARVVRVQVCVRRGLRLIVPLGFDPKKAEGILQKHRLWIERTWRRVQPISVDPLAETLPECLNLKALGEVWQLRYEALDKTSVRIKTHESDQILRLYGAVQDVLKVKKALRRWLHQRAQAYFSPWLEGLCQETGLTITGVNIRNTHSRWGSCSFKKNISLSCRLLFISPLLVEHVLLHELCHTVHFNHSKLFWDLLKSVSPDTSCLRKALKTAARDVPHWL